ncbi:MAG: UxaA family hydrolase, partial [Bacteroidales bacterium]|nr:UxaA family hydrolase [Bacteroidales bacterium]
MQKKIIKIHPSDNVVVALVDLVLGDVIDFEGSSITIGENIKAKHKIAPETLTAGDKIIMYGVLVGKASQKIEKGNALTINNVKHESAKVSGKTAKISWSAPDIEKWIPRTFLGFHREDGQVGTQNVWLFFPLVFCENRNIEILKDVFETELLNQKVNSHRLLLR